MDKQTTESIQINFSDIKIKPVTNLTIHIFNNRRVPFIESVSFFASNV